MRVLWISDAGTQTGFSRATHAIGERLVRHYGHEVHVLAIGWDAADPVDSPMHLYRAEAAIEGVHHPAGFPRIVELLDRVKPDVVVTLEDAPILYKRLAGNPWDSDRRLLATPILAYLPVDGYELPPQWGALLTVDKILPVAMSFHGQVQLHELNKGIEVPVVWHGVDADVFHPVDAEHPIVTSTGMTLRSKAECREAFDIPQGAFVIGRVDTNTGRKDWGATWRVIENYVRLHGQAEEMLAVFHTKAQAPSGMDLGALMEKSAAHYVITNGGDWPVENVVALMACFDVFLTTSRGEGFGLTIAEAMACGIPILATDGSAITEVVGPGGVLVDPAPSSFWMNPYGVVQHLSDTWALTEQLAFLARNPERRRQLGTAGMEHVRRNFTWDEAAARFHGLIESVAKVKDDAVRSELGATAGS